jgi:hypothetical protein
MERAMASLVSTIAIMLVSTATGIAQPQPPQPGQAAAQPHTAPAPSAAGTGMGMMGPRMFAPPPMAGHPMIPGATGMMPGGFIDMQFMQMMMSDPKTRARMMEIEGRMMKEMGELMEQRAKELQQGKQG